MPAGNPGAKDRTVAGSPHNSAMANIVVGYRSTTHTAIKNSGIMNGGRKNSDTLVATGNNNTAKAEAAALKDHETEVGTERYSSIMSGADISIHIVSNRITPRRAANIKSAISYCE